MRKIIMNNNNMRLLGNSVRLKSSISETASLLQSIFCDSWFSTTGANGVSDQTSQTLTVNDASS
jgi:hypothetical protein